MSSTVCLQTDSDDFVITNSVIREDPVDDYSVIIITTKNGSEIKLSIESTSLCCEDTRVGYEIFATEQDYLDDKEMVEREYSVPIYNTEDIESIVGEKIDEVGYAKLPRYLQSKDNNVVAILLRLVSGKRVVLWACNEHNGYYSKSYKVHWVNFEESDYL